MLEYHPIITLYQIFTYQGMDKFLHWYVEKLCNVAHWLTIIAI